MYKTLSLDQFFGVQRKPEHPGIASIKAKVRPSRAQAISPTLHFVGFALAAANVLVMLSYLLGVNAAASTGYEIKKVQQNIDSLSMENKQLNLKIAEQSSIAAIQADFAGEGFVPAGQATYLQINHYSER